MQLLWQLATLFTERHPSLRFQLFALSSDQILGRLNQNQFDVGIPILSVSTRRISRACRWVQHGCCTTGVTFAFQVPVTWEGAGEASARHVVERHAFSAITRSHVAQSRLESRPGLETDAVCRIWNTASVRAQSKHHPLPLDLLTETTSRDGQTPDLILKTLRCARLCSSVRADLPFSPTEPLGPGGRDSNPPLALGSFGEASHTPTSKFVALKVIKIGKQTERNLLAHA
ncbi:hypothetical protein [Stutzerimonas xanthomarina]|uniref:hypothetical protein n=1 Tax=Stutzerimonas xanthomarina TaxID=271420 RepID=UPI003C6F79DD